MTASRRLALLARWMLGFEYKRLVAAMHDQERVVGRTIARGLALGAKADIKRIPDGWQIVVRYSFGIPEVAVHVGDTPGLHRVAMAVVDMGQQP